MTVTGLFFLQAHTPDSSPTQEILQRLSSYYNSTPLPPWSLRQQLFRETPSTPRPATTTPTADKANSKPPPPRSLQLLHLPHHAPHTYISITNAAEPATIVSIPAGHPTEDFVQLLLSKFGPLWQPRQTLTVGQGHAYEVGDFKIRVGELRQVQGGGGVNAQMARGAVVEVEWVGDGDDQRDRDGRSGDGKQREDEEEDWEGAEAIIRGFWQGLDIKGAREVFRVPGLASGEARVRQWCELLRGKG